MNEEIIEILARIYKELQDIKENQEVLNIKSREELDNQERILRLLNEIACK